MFRKNLTRNSSEAPLRASQNSFDFKIANGGSIETTNAIKQKAKFSFTADSTASLVYATSDNLDNQNIPTHHLFDVP